MHHHHSFQATSSVLFLTLLIQGYIWMLDQTALDIQQQQQSQPGVTTAPASADASCVSWSWPVTRVSVVSVVKSWVVLVDQQSWDWELTCKCHSSRIVTLSINSFTSSSSSNSVSSLNVVSMGFIVALELMCFLQQAYKERGDGKYFRTTVNFVVIAKNWLLRMKMESVTDKTVNFSRLFEWFTSTSRDVSRVHVVQISKLANLWRKRQFLSTQVS